MNKRGISPIFATVLLIAFAVAIGAMIMNWSAGLTSGFSCDNAKIESGSFCITGNIMRLSIKNTGKEKISGLAVGSEKLLDDLNILPGESKNAEADFTEPVSKRGVRIVPIIKSDTDLLQCSENAIVIEKPNGCS